MDVGPSTQAGRRPPSTPGLPGPRGLSDGLPETRVVPGTRVLPETRVVPDPSRSA